MLVNSSITIYHKTFDSTTRLEKWERYNYEKVWFFGGTNASTNKGITETESVNVRIPYKENPNLDIDNISVGDILVEGIINTDIDTQSDLSCITYNITGITNNKYGANKHIHIRGI